MSQTWTTPASAGCLPRVPFYSSPLSCTIAISSVLRSKTEYRNGLYDIFPKYGFSLRNPFKRLKENNRVCNDQEKLFHKLQLNFFNFQIPSLLRLFVMKIVKNRSSLVPSINHSCVKQLFLRGVIIWL